ncbi:MAG: hypothetical protein ACREJT_05670 [Myxococcota bacterium]
MRAAAGFVILLQVSLLLVAVVAALSLIGCAPARVVVKTVPVEVTKYVKTPIPPELTKPCVYQTQEPACTMNGKRILCNDQLLSERDGYRLELRLCDADKTELRKLGVTP